MTDRGDFARAIAAAAGDAQALLALSIELAAENEQLRAIAARQAELEERELERKATRARQKREERERRSQMSRDIARHDATNGTVARQGESVSDVARRSSPLVPSPPFPEPNPSSPLNPLSSLPLASEARVRLGALLVSDADRAALESLLVRVPNPAAWLAEMQASLDGMSGHALVTPVQLGQALRDYVANGATQRPALRHFRHYLTGARARPHLTPDQRTANDVATELEDWATRGKATERLHA